MVEIFFKQYNITAESFEGRTLLKYKKRFFSTPYAGYVTTAVRAFITALKNFVDSKYECSNNTVCQFPAILNREYFFQYFLKDVTFNGLLNENVRFNKYGDVATPTYHVYNIQYQKGKPKNDKSWHLD